MIDVVRLVERAPRLGVAEYEQLEVLLLQPHRLLPTQLEEGVESRREAREERELAEELVPVPELLGELDPSVDLVPLWIEEERAEQLIRTVASLGEVCQAPSPVRASAQVLSPAGASLPVTTAGSSRCAGASSSRGRTFVRIE